jgi:hypothetical protein
VCVCACGMCVSNSVVCVCAVCMWFVCMCVCVVCLYVACVCVVWCVVCVCVTMCDLETSAMGRPRPVLQCCATQIKVLVHVKIYCLQHCMRCNYNVAIPNTISVHIHRPDFEYHQSRSCNAHSVLYNVMTRSV